MKLSLKKLRIWILVLIFALPGIAACYIYLHPEVLSGNTINRGHLLQPAVKLTSLPASHKWQLMFWPQETCDAMCLQHVDELARIRLALGRKLYSVTVGVLLTAEQSAMLPAAVKKLWREQDISIELVADSDKRLLQSIATSAVCLLDPKNYMILIYNHAKPQDIFADLKHLITLDSGGMN